MNNIPLFQVDAFTSQPFSGNPAAVCLLDKAADARWMRAVGAEMNLSETAFVWREADGFGLRWFTPDGRSRFVRTCHAGYCAHSLAGRLVGGG